MNTNHIFDILLTYKKIIKECNFLFLSCIFLFHSIGNEIEQNNKKNENIETYSKKGKRNKKCKKEKKRNEIEN